MEKDLGIVLAELSKEIMSNMVKYHVGEIKISIGDIKLEIRSKEG